MSTDLEIVATQSGPANLLPHVSAGDAEVDIEVLKAVPKQFCVCDEKTANWLVKKVIAARQYAQHVKEWAEQEHRRAEREEQTLLFLFGRQIESWTKEQIAALNGKRKSLGLPAGTVGFRTVAPKLVIDDEKAVIQWAKQHCKNAVVVVERLSKSTLDGFLQQTGAIPDDGAHIEVASERFYMK